MHFFDRIPSSSLEHPEIQLILTASLAIIVLGCGLVLFMYPEEFSPMVPPNRALASAIFDYCVLTVLVIGNLVIDRQKTFQKLRHQIAEDRVHSSHAVKQASANLLQALPNFDSFQGRLPVEYRHAVSVKSELSVLVVATQLHGALAGSSERGSALGDSSKAIYRKPHEQNSVCVFTAGYFGPILPWVGVSIAQQICARLSKGLTDAAGAANRITFKIDAFSYPDQASCRHDVELAVTGSQPELSLASH